MTLMGLSCGKECQVGNEFEPVTPSRHKDNGGYLSGYGRNARLASYHYTSLPAIPLL